MDGRVVAQAVGASVSRRTALRRIAIGAAAIAAIGARPTTAFAAQATMATPAGRGMNIDSINAPKNLMACNITCTTVDCCPGGCCNPPSFPYLARCDATCGYYFYVCTNSCTTWCYSQNC